MLIPPIIKGYPGSSRWRSKPCPTRKGRDLEGVDETAETSFPTEVVAAAEIVDGIEVIARRWKFRGAVSMRGNEQEKDS